MAVSMGAGKKYLLRVALGGSLVTGLGADRAEAAWPAARCAAQCNIINAGKKVADKATDKGILSSERKDMIYAGYAKILNDCAENCDNGKIADILFSGYGSLRPDNLKNLNSALKTKRNSKWEELADVQSQLASNVEKQKPGSKIQTFRTSRKIKDLESRRAKLQDEIKKLDGQIGEIQESLPSKEEERRPSGENRPKLSLEKDVLGKIAHPEGQEFMEPIIPGMDGFVDDKATLRADNTLTKWGIVKILQATGVIVKRDPDEKRMIEVRDVKDKTKMTKVVKPLDKDDVDRIITNDPTPKQAGTYSEVVYFITVNPRYLANGHTNANYVLKKNKWAFGKEQVKDIKRTRDQNTPAKELIDLKKVQAYIMPKLSGAKYGKIAAIGNSAFYLDEEGEKQYFVVLDAADGRPLFDLFDTYAKDGAKWHEIMFNVGRAVGELHLSLSDDPKGETVPQDFRFSNIKTIPHGDMHMSNVFYNEKDGAVTFIDTGSMADSLKSKGSPTTDFIQIFGTTKYFHRVYHADFNKIDADFIPFAEGYSQGFSANKKTQEKIKTLLLDYLKFLSTEYGKTMYLKMENMPDNDSPPIIKAYFGHIISDGGYSWPFVNRVFHDDFVSKEVKEGLASHLVQTHQIDRNQAHSVVAKATPASWPLNLPKSKMSQTRN